MKEIGRWEFLGQASAIGVSVTSGRIFARPSAGPGLHVTYMAPADEVIDDVYGGIQMGIEEAQHSAAMFGGTVTLGWPHFGGSIAVGHAVAKPNLQSVPDAVHVVIPGLMSREVLDQTIALTRDAGAIMFNASVRNGRASGFYDACSRDIFNVRPSPATMAAARASLPDTAAGEMELWSQSLTRFGADSLNRRYQSFASRPMKSAAWGGWFAVKCAWEGVLQSKAKTARELAAWLEGPKARFDGHKGASLYFNASHELVQPLYLVNRQEVIGETNAMASRVPATPCA
jgi:hypothetical protein